MRMQDLFAEILLTMYCTSVIIYTNTENANVYPVEVEFN